MERNLQLGDMVTLPPVLGRIVEIDEAKSQARVNFGGDDAWFPLEMLSRYGVSLFDSMASRGVPAAGE